MSLREKINEQFNTALKSKNKTLVSTLRLILAAIKEKDIANRSAKNREDVKDPEIIKVLRRMKKQRQDSANLYKKGERQELLEAEEAEIKIVDTFLPKQLSEEETQKICKETIESTGASSIKDMGKIIGSLKKKYSASIDFSKVNIIIRLTLEKSIESGYFCFNEPIILPMSLILDAPTDSITSLQIFFVSSSLSCFGKNVSIILISSSSASNNSCLFPFSLIIGIGPPEGVPTPIVWIIMPKSRACFATEIASP